MSCLRDSLVACASLNCKPALSYSATPLDNLKEITLITRLIKQEIKATFKLVSHNNYNIIVDVTGS